MTLNLIPLGYDCGNGWHKIALDNKASKIPNWHITDKPKGELTSKMVASKPMTFSLLTSKGVRWFGQDTLSQSGYQEIDTDKYQPEYIRIMFKAALWRWITQHNIDPSWLTDKRLNVVCGMPPEKYQDRQAQSKALKAYRHTFDEKRPQYIKFPNKPTVSFFTTFGGLKPETLSWRAAHTLKPGFTLLADLGFGTSDLCLLHSDRKLPVSTVSLPNGLLHSHQETNSIMPWLAELDAMRKNSKPEVYGNVTKGKIRSVARQLDLVQLAVFGGGIRLFDKKDIANLKTYAIKYWQGDEFTNCRMFEKLAGE